VKLNHKAFRKNYRT